MTISRWKVMAGILGVSIGGLAAIAGQCPKGEAGKTHRSDPHAAADAPKAPSAGSKPAAPALPAPPIDVPPPPAIGEPALPVLPAIAPAAPAKSPELPVAAKPAAAEPMPLLPLPPAETKTTTKTPDLPKTAAEMPVKAPVAPAIPDLDVAVKPSAPPMKPVEALPLPAVPVTIESTKPVAPPVGADPVVPVPPTLPMTAPSGAAYSAAPLGVTPPAPVAAVETTPAKSAVTTIAATTPAVPAVAKFRVVLRVGEGEPMFEVRSGDDLVMKVVCEKVDIKSPEKGQTMSDVTATGKVRFVGFGAEGTCDAFTFKAGAGTVDMNGNVKVQMKDKIGRVESGPTTAKMSYKLDAHAMPGVLKP